MSSLQVALLSATAKPPTRGSVLAAGFDLYASEPATIPPQSRGLVSTGIAIGLDAGTYGRVAPRSGLAVKHGIQTGAGVIDADYRGEVKVLLFNHDPNHEFTIKPGDRIAQLIIEKIQVPDGTVIVDSVDKLGQTDRGAGGFGSTGI